MEADTDCSQCHHSHYDHIDWKLDTPYADNHSGCRITGCGCLNYTAALIHAFDLARLIIDNRYINFIKYLQEATKKALIK